MDPDDLAFLTDMLEIHSDGVDLADSILDDTDDDEVTKAASDMKATSQAHVDNIKQYLSESTPDTGTMGKFWNGGFWS